ncbi:MAG TPA: CHAT domain-containing protein [Thermoanaerobaculia bacterium]|nr:CHAT domain-containing protein [Thermoanaerobaculia bacterium]
MTATRSTPSRIDVLLVCANPRGTNQLRTAEEERVLKEAVRLSSHRDRISVTVLNAATIDDVRRELLKQSFQVVHFSGHGTNSGLVFEDTAGRLMVPDSAALAELLQRRGASTAVLNACYSLATGSLTSLGLDYTIAMEGPIADDAAIEFTRGFYDAVGAGLAIPEAYEEGLTCVRLKHMALNAILLRKGEAHVADARNQSGIDETNRTVAPTPALVGIAIDTSGSMEGSISNDRNRELSRLQGVRDAVFRYATHFRAALTTGDVQAPFRLFAYAFGLRSGDVADLLSLIRAARSINLEHEVEKRKSRYVADAKRKAGEFAGLAGLAQGWGFGNVVSSIERAATAAAEADIRSRITAEIATLLAQEASQIGDTTATPAELAELFDDTTAGKFSDLEPIIYGNTPMVAATSTIADRFAREPKLPGERRMFLLVSDGEPTDGDPLPNLLKLQEQNITVVTCYVTNRDVVEPRLLRSSADSTWPKEAKLMFEAASALAEGDVFSRQLLRSGWIVEPKARLFVQVNHSELLSDFVQTVASTFGPTVDVLPKGH